MQSPEKPPKTGSLLPLGLAGCLGLLVGAVLLFLTLGFAAQATGIAAALFGVVAFHYLVWGRWLGATIRAEVEAEEREAASRAHEPQNAAENNR
jgi:hypothetical protein